MINMKPVCPFVKAARPDDNSSRSKPGDCPVKPQAESENKSKKDSSDSVTRSAKCPFGYDSNNFKLGLLSYIICHSLLYESSKCVPCSHIFWRACISRFKDCPLCGADIEKIEPEEKLQETIDRFIEGHARIKRFQVDKDEGEAVGDNKPVIYEDVSKERGAFLVQQAMRAFRSQNIESAKSRLILCGDDIREQLQRMGNTAELCSQLGAVLGMLGDCCRATGDSGAAISYFQESAEFLSKLPSDDLEIIHTLSVSLNKIGDLKYYEGDLKTARPHYFQALNIRLDVVKHHLDVPSLVLDVAVSLAKVADIDRNIGDENLALDGFQEAITLLEKLSLNSEMTAMEQRRLSALEFLRNQVADKPT